VPAHSFLNRFGLYWRSSFFRVITIVVIGTTPFIRALFPIQANAALIPARGNMTQGAAYKFVDWSIEKGGTCFYKLEDINLSSNAHDTRSGERFSKAHLFNAVR
jgi:hypothetical protein